MESRSANREPFKCVARDEKNRESWLKGQLSPFWKFGLNFHDFVTILSLLKEK